MGRLFREPDEDSGPALLDREPVILPEERKQVAERVKEVVNGDGDDGVPSIHDIREDNAEEEYL